MALDESFGISFHRLSERLSQSSGWTTMTDALVTSPGKGGDIDSKEASKTGC